MNFKRKINNLDKFKKEMDKYSHLEKNEINSAISWLSKLQKSKNNFKDYKCQRL